MLDLRMIIAFTYLAIIIFGEWRINKLLKEEAIENARSIVRKSHLIIAVIAICEGIMKIAFDYEWLGGFSWDASIRIAFGLFNIIFIKYPDFRIAFSPFTQHDYIKWKANKYEQKVTQINLVKKPLVKLNSQDYLDMVSNRLESESFEILRNINCEDYAFEYVAKGKHRIAEIPVLKYKVVYIFNTSPSIGIQSLNEYSSQAIKYFKKTFSKHIICVPVAIVDDVDPSICEQVRKMRTSQIFPIEMPVVNIPSANELAFSGSNTYRPKMLIGSSVYSLGDSIIYSLREHIIDVLAPWTWESDNVEVEQAEA